MNRVIQIESGAERIFKDGHHVAETVKKNFGQLGPVIIKAIKILGFEKLNEMIKQYFEEAKQGKMEKQAQSAATLIVADHIVTDAIFHDGDYLTVEQLKPYLRGENEISENLRCYVWLHDQTDIFSANFYDDDYPAHVPSEVWGRKDDAHKMVYFIPSALSNLISSRSSFSMRAFIRWAKNNGVLRHQKDRETYKSRIQAKAEDGSVPQERKTCYAIDFGSPAALGLFEKAEKKDDHFVPDTIPFD